MDAHKFVFKFRMIVGYLDAELKRLTRIKENEKKAMLNEEV